MSHPEQSPVLSSWKDIARYIGKGVRTVQRWEHELGLPVRRPNGASQKSAVVLNRRELDSWLETRFSARGTLKNGAVAREKSSRTGSATLRENMRKAQELRSANLILTEQISQSLRRLTQQCGDVLDNLSNPIPKVPRPVPDLDCAGAEASTTVARSEQVV